MKKVRTIVSILVICFWGFTQLQGQISEKITIHGFGGWGYGNTNGYHYQFGDDNGDYNHAQFYLNINANPFEKMHIIAQVGGTQSLEGIHFEFDYAFAQWSFSDLVQLRFGKVKHPFGIFGEILNVGTVRPFMMLPQGIYGDNGYVGRGLNGIALTGSIFSAQGWGLQYDLYWGQLKTVARMTNILPYSFTGVPAMLSDEIITNEKKIVDMWGGRISVSLPLDGLSIGFSAYSGDGDTDGSAMGMSGSQYAFGPAIEYVSSILWVRSEYKRFVSTYKAGDMEDTNKSSNFYMEVAARITQNWQLAARYDWYEGTSNDPILRPFVRHQDMAIGLNYWFNSNLVLKAAYHWVEGLRFAYPRIDDPMSFYMDLLADKVKKTQLLQLGVHFSF